MLIGREPELTIVERLLTADTGERSLIVDGAPGIGKTAFLGSVSELALSLGHRILTASPAEAEAELSFAGLADLLEGGASVDLSGLPEPQRIALEVALLLRSPGETGPQPRAVGTGLLNALSRIASREPVLLIVDDAQWLDQPSASAIQFSLRRLTSERVYLILARRAGNEIHGGWAGTQSVLELSPLTLGATHALLSQRLGIPLKRPALLRIHEWSRGNPLHSLELGRAYVAGRVRFDDSASVPLGLEHLVASRIQRLPDETRIALAALAAASSTSIEQLELVIDGGEAAAVLEPALTDGIIEISESSVRFTHPLLASAAYSAVDLETQRAIHARLAGSIDDPDERARHLAHSIDGPDPEVASALDQAADNVFRRGAPLLAAGLVSMAREATPDDRPAEARRRALAEAEYRFEAGDTLAAAQIVSDLIAEQSPGPDRAALLSLLARFHHFADGLAGSSTYLHIARNEAGNDPRLRFGIEEGLAWNIFLMRGDLATADQAAVNAVESARELGDPAAEAEALAIAALTRSALGGDATDLMDQALALEPATLHLRVLRHPGFSHASLLTTLDRFDEAHEVFTELVRRAEANGDESALPTLLHHISLIECLHGDLTAALAHAGEAAEIAAQDDQVPARTSSLGRVALVHARLGDATSAETAANQALALACPEGYDPDDPRPAMARGGEVAIWAIAVAALASGDVVGAARHLTPLARLFRKAGYRSAGDTRFLADTVEALSLNGDLEDCAGIVAWMDTMPVDRPGPFGTLAMSRGLLAAAQGDLVDSEQHLTAAAEALQSAQLPFEQARALLALGKVQRRSRSKKGARQSLIESVEVFSSIGSEGWSAVARKELERVGGGDRSDHGFTETELQVAVLVAAGHSNKEVAQKLYVSPKTVEATLTRLYAKIGIRSRTDLVRWTMDWERSDNI